MTPALSWQQHLPAATVLVCFVASLSSATMSHQQVLTQPVLQLSAVVPLVGQVLV